MKKILKLIESCLLSLCCLPFFSCQKEKIWQAEAGIAKVNVINAVVTGGNAKVNISENKINWTSIHDNQALGGFTVNRMFIVPTDRSTVFQVVPLSDTTKMWYNQISKLNSGKIYTLYLSGTPTDLKTKLEEESDFPDYVLRDAGKSIPSADSIVNIRFANLSSSGPKVDISIQGENTIVANGLTYQAFTEFKTYPATNGVYSIAFEIRKSSDKSLVRTYYFNADFFRFKSVSVVLMGMYNTPGLPAVDNYRIVAIPYQ